MSRLIVKNLPTNVSETKLTELFNKKGKVTDVQLKFTNEKKFRRFGFVGFETDNEANEALHFFNNSYIDTSRITVERCAGLGDVSKPKSWSKYAPDNEVSKEKNTFITEFTKVRKKDKYKQKILCTEIKNNEKMEENKKKWEYNENTKIQQIIEKHNKDPLFSEFLQCHSNVNSEVWKNDTKLINEKDVINEFIENEDDAESENNMDSRNNKVLSKENISDKEYFQILKTNSLQKNYILGTKKKDLPNTFYTVKIRGLAYNHKKKNIKEFFRGMKPKSIRLPPKIKGIAYVGFKTEKYMKLALAKNKSFLDGKRIFINKFEPHNKVINSDEITDKNLRWKQQEETLKSEENIAESGKLFLRNLAYTTNEEQITELFEKYGPLSEVDLPIDKLTRKLKGFGTVTFLIPEHAVKAYSELDGSVQNGRMLHLLPAKSKISEDSLVQDSLNYKQKKELDKKTNSGSSHNWNTLFLGHNAVADAIANTYNTTKENVLEEGNGTTSAAVRLALGETQLVQETCKFLEESGVHLDAFNQAPKKRSKNIILVKNLPAGTHVKEIREMFSKYGKLEKLILPPSGITALVEFAEPSEARKAFTRLAYSKFKSLPLYLEWAPDNSFISLDRNNTLTNGSLKIKELQNNKNENLSKIKVENNDSTDEDEVEPEDDTTLFVKNLNFSTTEEQLIKHFSRCGPLHYANISMKKDPNNPEKKLSMGFGFVRYKYKSNAEQALKELQMTSLEGKNLELKRSERTLQTDLKSTRKLIQNTKQTGTKILVRNIPFQANTTEIKELFTAFGEIKSVRLPKKLIGEEKHRGFGFVEFYTKKEAKSAYKALCQSTHLYGRRLVLEWAQTEEGIEDLRKRTKKHFYEDQITKRKKSFITPEEIDLKIE